MKRHIIGWSGLAGLGLTAILVLVAIGQASAHLATHWCPCMTGMVDYLARIVVTFTLILGAGVASAHVWVAYWKG